MMIGRRAFFSALGAAPVLARKAIELSVEDVRSEAASGPWELASDGGGYVEDGFDDATLALQSALSRRTDRQHMLYARRDKPFEHMKSWSKRFREDEWIREEMEERSLQSEISRIVYDNRTSYLEKVAKLAMLGVKVV